MTKRRREDDGSNAVDVGLGPTLAVLREEGDVVTTTPSSDIHNDNEGWTVVGPKRRKKDCSPSLPFSDHEYTEGREGSNKSTTMDRDHRRKERKLERHYPSIEHSHHARLQSYVKLSDLQALVLYLLADGHAPQWVSVRNRSSIQRVVMLMVPGLDGTAFDRSRFYGQSKPTSTVSSNFQVQEGSTHDQGDYTTIKPEEGGLQSLCMSPDGFYPVPLKPNNLPAPSRPLAYIFDHVWPIKAPGDHRANQYIKLHSPVHSMLTSQIPKTQEEKQLKKKKNHKGPLPQDLNNWENKRTRITDFIASLADQQENDYVLHPAMFTTEESKEAAMQRRRAANQGPDDGWVDTNVLDLADGVVPESEIEHGSITAGRDVISVDCEMCKADNDEFVLTRVSLLRWDGTVVLDKLVKPDVPIKDYLTQWSGITPAMLEDVTTSLLDVQKELLLLITPRTILVGHSLNSDLNALKLTHPFIVDTGILYPHPRGAPYKQSLKWLAQKYLHREVQKGQQGHDSVEDARTCLDLVKQKCERGPAWGSGTTNAESLFKRLGRSDRPQPGGGTRAGAVIDWGDPNRGHGSQAQVSVGCKTDDEVVNEIDKTLKGHQTGKGGDRPCIDFIWGRLRELELSRGWCEDVKSPDIEAARRSTPQGMGVSENIELETGLGPSDLSKAVSETVSRITQVYNNLPRCTAFIVYSGIGDPRAMYRLQAMYQQYRREYQTKNWDNLSVKWTDTEVQALSRACQEARNGIALIGVK